MDNSTLIVNNEVVAQMFGSTHTHFEDLYDTANDLTEMVRKFASLGAKRVALTGHGSMFAYEDLKEIVASLKGKGEISEDFEIVPGCEVYFTDNARHMVLVAKNYEGYQDLCKVISESAKNSKTSRNTSEEVEYLTPLVTMSNLQDNIRKGNVYMTTACIGGVFGHDLGLVEDRLRKDVEKEKKKVGDMEVFQSLQDIVEEYTAKKNDPANKMPTKAEWTKANKMIEKQQDFSMQEELTARQQVASEYQQWKMENQPIYENARKEIKKYEKKFEKVKEAEAVLENYLSTEEERWQAARQEYADLRDVFGDENIYFELQNHGIPVEKTIFNNVIKLAYMVGNPHFIASNDVHIGDVKGSDTWNRSVLKRRVEKFNRFNTIEKRDDEEEYGIKTDAELREALLNIVEDFCLEDGVVFTPKEEIVDNAIENIRYALEECKVIFPEISLEGVNHYPKFCDNEQEMFEAEVRKGLAKRFPNGFPSEEYEKRMEYELHIIKSMGYAGYHLIVKDYLEYGRLLGFLRTQEEIDNAPLSIEELNKYIDDNHIPRIGMGIGPGRGSAAGSLCCFGLGITDVDPLKHGLLFERFLNPSRQTMPDIDSDFKEDIRERVYEYIKAKYGDECVSKVCTKAYAYGKAAVGIAQRYLTKEKQEQVEDKAVQEEIKKTYLDLRSSISKKIENTVKSEGLNATKVEDGTKALKIMLDRGELTEAEAEVASLAVDISGIPSNLSMHACAALISGDPLAEVIPLAWNEKNKKMTTQCLYPQAENLGLLKMDLLNIKNLGVITKVMQSNDNPDKADARLTNPEEVEKILQDPKIYADIYSKGYTKGVFQVESDGMTKMMKDFQPTCFDDIVLLVAAYRPGPLDFIPEIIASKKYKEDPVHNKPPKRSIDIDNKVLNDILAPTYGVPVYQEQVMQIFQHLAGYDLAGADNVRRFMSKKKMEPLKKEKPAFIYGDPERNIPGCIAAGLTEQQADDLFEKLVEFSKYAFNKSHALCYAQVSVYTAYQKRYFPTRFYKHSLSNEMRDGGAKGSVIDKYSEELQRLGIELLPPDIAKSQEDFTIEYINGKPAIRMGFGNIKGHSYEEYNPAGSIYSFILKNPEVSLTVVDDFAKLGMFSACWLSKDHIKEVERTNGNRSAMQKWIETYGQMVKDLALLYKEKAELTEALANADKLLRVQEKSCSLEELVTLKANTENLSAELDKKNAKIAELREELDAGKIKEDNAGNLPQDTPDKVSEYRNFELDKLGKVFHMEKSLEMIRQHGSNRTFEALYQDENYDNAVSIPAAVVSCEEKKSKNGSVFYSLKLMDRLEKTIDIRSFHKPTVMEGNFYIKRSVSTSGYENITCQKEYAFKNQQKDVSSLNKNNLNEVNPHLQMLPDGTPFMFGIQKDQQEEIEEEKEEKERE